MDEILGCLLWVGEDCARAIQAYLTLDDSAGEVVCIMEAIEPSQSLPRRCCTVVGDAQHVKSRLLVTCAKLFQGVLPGSGSPQGLPRFGQKGFDDSGSDPARVRAEQAFGELGCVLQRASYPRNQSQRWLHGRGGAAER